MNRSCWPLAAVALIVPLIAACAGTPSSALPSPTPAIATDATPSTPVGGSSPSLPPTVAAPAFTATFEPATVAPAGAITIEMGTDGRPIFTPRAVTGKPGSILLYVANGDPLTGGIHDFRIGPERGVVVASTPALRPGEAVVLTLSDVEPAKYTFWCEILRHWDFGMVGTLTVEP